MSNKCERCKEEVVGIMVITREKDKETGEITKRRVCGECMEEIRKG